MQSIPEKLKYLIKFLPESLAFSPIVQFPLRLYTDSSLYLKQAYKFFYLGTIHTRYRTFIV
jgi:hypothetical protein